MLRKGRRWPPPVEALGNRWFRMMVGGRWSSVGRPCGTPERQAMTCQLRPGGQLFLRCPAKGAWTAGVSGNGQEELCDALAGIRKIEAKHQVDGTSWPGGPYGISERRQLYPGRQNGNRVSPRDEPQGEHSPQEILEERVHPVPLFHSLGEHRRPHGSTGGEIRRRPPRTGLPGPDALRGEPAKTDVGQGAHRRPQGGHRGTTHLSARRSSRDRWQRQGSWSPLSRRPERSSPSAIV